MQRRTVRDKESEENSMKQKMLIFFFPPKGNEKLTIPIAPSHCPAKLLSFLKNPVGASSFKLQQKT